jgi:D-3-phosphoglycerate dehydrogenase
VVGKPGVICVPHLGASTPESEENCARMAAKTLRDYLENGNIVNSVNLPQCTMPVSGVCRVCALHKNVTNMVGQITSVLANAGVNIANMINQSRGDIAYTLLDLDHMVDEKAAKAIEAIPGMIRVRILRYE